MDNECAKCGGYSGGANLCLICEKSALKRNAKKPRRRKLDPLCQEMLATLEGVIQGRHFPEMRGLIDRVKARFKTS